MCHFHCCIVPHCFRPRPLTRHHRLEVAVVAHKLAVLALLDDPSLQGACHHRAPAWEKDGLVLYRLNQWPLLQCL